MAPVPADPAPLAALAEAWLWSLEPVIQDAFLYCKVAGDQLSVSNGKVTRHTVSNSGLPRQRAIASQKRTAARSTPDQASAARTLGLAKQVRRRPPSQALVVRSPTSASVAEVCSEARAGEESGRLAEPPAQRG